MLEAVYASLSSTSACSFGAGGRMPARTGNRHGGLAESPYNVYPASDGYIAIICVGEQHWKTLLDAMGRAELGADPRFASLKTRVAHMDVIDDLVERLHQAIQQAGSVRAADEASRAVRAGAHLDGGRERPAPASARHAAMDRSSGARAHRRAVEPDALRRRAAAAASSRAAGSAPTTRACWRLARPSRGRSRAPREGGRRSDARQVRHRRHRPHQVRAPARARHGVAERRGVPQRARRCRHREIRRRCAVRQGADLEVLLDVRAEAGRGDGPAAARSAACGTRAAPPTSA